MTWVRVCAGHFRDLPATPCVAPTGLGAGTVDSRPQRREQTAEGLCPPLLPEEGSSAGRREGRTACTSFLGPCHCAVAGTMLRPAGPRGPLQSLGPGRRASHSGCCWTRPHSLTQAAARPPVLMPPSARCGGGGLGTPPTLDFRGQTSVHSPVLTPVLPVFSSAPRAPHPRTPWPFIRGDGQWTVATVPLVTASASSPWRPA